MTMDPQETGASPKGLSRRAFIKSSAVTAAAVASQGLVGAYAAGSDRLRIGLIGCGGRGSGAALNALESSPNVELVALGDLFQDRLDDFRHNLASQGDKVKIADDHCFTGFDAY